MESRDRETLAGKWRSLSYPLILLLLGALRFVNLGFVDMQAWDEGLYAVRAISILKFGGWIDQSAHAIGGLYSALHPPLYIWLEALSLKIFGITEFAVRFPSALLAAGTLLIIFAIGKNLADRETGFIAALLYGINPFVDFYARQGQFDSALVFFLTLAVYLIIIAEKKSSNRFAFLSGLAVGCALMTKLFVGFGIPLAYGIWWIFRKDRMSGDYAKKISLMLVASLLVAGPWHAYMVIVHGNGNPLWLLQASEMFARVVSGIEGNQKSLEIFYFANQLLVLFPIGLSWFLYGIVRAFRNRNGEDGGIWWLPALWFLIFFFVFSAMRTKLAFYILPMLVPASLLAGREFRRAMAGELSKKIVAPLVGFSMLASVWAASQEWRDAIKLLLGGTPHTVLDDTNPWGLIPFFGLIALSVALAFLLYLFGFPARLWGMLPYIFLLPLSGFSLYTIGVLDREQYNDGGRDLARFVERGGYRDMVVAGFERNPQISYYLDGVDAGWRTDIAFRRIQPPADSALVMPWLTAAAANAPAGALFVVERDRLIRHLKFDTPEILPAGYAVAFQTRRYVAFQIPPAR